MDARAALAEQIKKHKSSLEFDRFNVHTKGENLRKAVNEARQFFQENHKTVFASADISYLYKQIGGYYLFKNRDYKTALLYLEGSLRRTVRNTPDYKEVSVWIECARAMDDHYHDSTELQALLDSYETERQEKKITEQDRVNEAMVLRHLALVNFRQSFLLLAENDKRSFDPVYMSVAIRHIEKACELTKKTKALGEAYAIDLAECHHLYAAMLIKQSTLANTEAELMSALQPAQDELDLAWILEKTIQEKTGSPYILEFKTRQLFAEVKRRLRKYGEAIDLLDEVCAAQAVFFGTNEHEDFAESVHFLGTVYLDKGDLAEAWKHYALSLNIRKKINSASLKITRDSMFTLLNSFDTLTLTRFIETTPEVIRDILQSHNHEFDEKPHQMTCHLNQSRLLELEALMSKLESCLGMPNGRVSPTEEAAHELYLLYYKMGMFKLHKTLADTVSASSEAAVACLRKAGSFLTGCERDMALVQVALVSHSRVVSDEVKIRKLIDLNGGVESEEIRKRKADRLENAKHANDICDIILGSDKHEKETYQGFMSKAPTNNQEKKQCSINALAYSIKAQSVYEMVEFTAETLGDIINFYGKALKLFKLSDVEQDDEQYALTRYKHAMALVEYAYCLLAVGHSQSAEMMRNIAAKEFKKLETDYWFKGFTVPFCACQAFIEWSAKNTNPFPGRFLKAYADFLVKTDPEEAKDRYEAAYKILCVTDGEKAALTVHVQQEIKQLVMRQRDKISGEQVVKQAKDRAAQRSASATSNSLVDSPMRVIANLPKSFSK